MTINVVINGREVELPDPVTVLDYLEENSLTKRRIGVAHNGEVIASERYAEIVIDDGDTLEIVRPVGGGG